jgi:hypothetical protein
MSSEVRKMRKALGIVMLLVLLFPQLVLAGEDGVTPQDVYNYIDCCLEVENFATKDRLKQAFQKGFEDGAVAPQRALQLLQEINESGAELQLREGVLLTIADALLGSVPVEMLINKVLEGLKRGVPMSGILAEIQERKATLQQVKVLLEGKGFKVGVELPVGNATIEITFEVAGVVITEIAGALEDYVRSGNDPANGLAVMRAVALWLQQDKRISATVVEWVKLSVSVEEWSRIAQSIAERLESMEGE